MLFCLDLVESMGELLLPHLSFKTVRERFPTHTAPACGHFVNDSFMDFSISALTPTVSPLPPTALEFNKSFGALHSPFIGAITDSIVLPCTHRVNPLLLAN